MTEQERPPRTLVRVEPHRPPNMELLDKIREAVLLSAAHLDLFQRKPSHQKLRAIIDNISFFHLQDIEREAGRAVQDDGLPSVEELAEAIMRHDADDSWPSGALVAHDRGRCGNNRCAATILHEVRRLRAAPPLHNPELER